MTPLSQLTPAEFAAWLVLEAQRVKKERRKEELDKAVKEVKEGR